MLVHPSRLLILAILFTATASGCSPKPQAGASAPTGTTQETTSNPIAGKADVTLPSEFDVWMVGTIGDLPVRMSLTRHDGDLSAAYYYETNKPALTSVLSTLFVSGTIDKTGRVQAVETVTNPDGEDKKTGMFEGTIKAESDGRMAFSGVWSKPDGSRKLDFRLQKRSVAALGGQMREEKWDEKDAKIAKVITVAFPVIDGASDKRAGQFNDAIRAFIANEVKEFRAFVEEDKPTAEDLETYALELTPDVTFASETVVSVVFSKYISFGGAHPASDLLCFNFNVATGKVLTLGELFTAGSSFRPLLKQRSELAIKGTQDMLIDLDSDEVFDQFYLTDHGIRFVCDVPHVLGDTAEIYIPYADLASVLDRARLGRD